MGLYQLIHFVSRQQPCEMYTIHKGINMSSSGMGTIQHHLQMWHLQTFEVQKLEHEASHLCLPIDRVNKTM